MLLDDKLTWSKHVAHVKSKISKVLGIFSKIKCKLNSQILKLLYNTMFLPYINYCSEVWGSSCAKNVNTIFILQKRAVRLICNTSPRAHTHSFFCNLKILKFEDLVQLKISHIIHKVKLHNLPPNIVNLLNLTIVNSHNTRNCSNYAHKYCRTNVKANCISVRGVVLYNNLSNYICTSKSNNQFKKRYKRYIFDSYNNHV